MQQFNTLDDFDFEDKVVLLRLDLNVPMKDGEIFDDTRIQRAKPTIDYLLEHGAKIILMSHYGRPQGNEMALSIAHVVRAIERSLSYAVQYIDTFDPVMVKKKIDTLKPLELGLLENLRFNPGEERNDPAFAGLLAEIGDIYVNDAFSVSHRAHASTEAIAKLLPCAAGRLMEQELSTLSSLFEAPKRPMAASLAGGRFRQNSMSSKTSCKRSIRFCLAAAWPTHFWPRKGLMLNSLYTSPT